MGGVQSQLLLDTGASSNFCAERLADKIPGIKRESATKVFALAQNSAIKPTAKAQLSVEIDGKVVNTPFYIVTELIADAILGCPFIYEAVEKIDVRHNSLTLRPELANAGDSRVSAKHTCPPSTQQPPGGATPSRPWPPQAAAVGDLGEGNLAAVGDTQSETKVEETDVPDLCSDTDSKSGDDESDLDEDEALGSWLEGVIRHSVEIDPGQVQIVRLDVKPKRETHEAGDPIDIPTRESFLIEGDKANCDTYDLYVLAGVVSAAQLAGLTYPVFSTSDFTQTLHAGMRLVRIRACESPLFVSDKHYTAHLSGDISAGRLAALYDTEGGSCDTERGSLPGSGSLEPIAEEGPSEETAVPDKMAAPGKNDNRKCPDWVADQVKGPELYPGPRVKWLKPETEPWRPVSADSPPTSWTETAKILEEKAPLSFPNVGATRQFAIDYTEPKPTADDELPPARDFDKDVWEQIPFEKCQLNPDQLKEFRALCASFYDVFGDQAKHVQATPLCMTGVLLTSYEPFKPVRPRIYPDHINRQIEAQVDEWLKCGIVEHSISPWTSQILAVERRGGKKLRCVQDLRRMNDLSIGMRHVMLTKRDVIRTLVPWVYASTVDLCLGFYALPIHPDHRKFFAGVTPLYRRKVQWARCTMGGKNSAQQFQLLMDHLFGTVPLFWSYVDDVLSVSPKGFRHHLGQLKLMFTRLRWAKLVLSPKKCAFFTKKCEFLGLTLFPNGVTPDRDRISAVLELEAPKTLKELRAFLGSAGHYCQGSVKYWASLSHPLFALCNNTAKAVRVSAKGNRKNLIRIPTKRIPLEWLPIHQRAFDAIKAALTSAPTLAYADKDRPFLIECDASEWQVGSILSQPSAQAPNVVAYFSRRFQGSELNWAIHKKECYGVCQSLKHWRNYVSGRRILVLTDAKSIVALFVSNDVTGILARFWTVLMRYNVWLMHRPGSKMTGADFLSRHPRREKQIFPLPILDSYEAACKLPLGANTNTRRAARDVLDSLLEADKVAIEQRGTQGALCTNLTNLTQTGPAAGSGHTDPNCTDIEPYGEARHEADLAGLNPSFARGIASKKPRTKAEPEEAIPYKATGELARPDAESEPPRTGRPLQDRPGVAAIRPDSHAVKTDPPSQGEREALGEEALVKRREGQSGDSKIRVIIQSLLEGTAKPSQDAITQSSLLAKQWKHLTLRGGVLYRRYTEPPMGVDRLQFVVPQSLRLQFLALAHDDSAHSGAAKTWEKLRAHCYWPGYQADTAKYVAACPACSEMQSHRQIPNYPLGSYFHGGYPFRCMVSDILGAIGGSKRGKFAILIMCNFTKFTCGEVLDDTKTSSVIRACINVFSRWGWPTVLRCDAGTCYTSVQFKSFCEQNGVLLRIGPSGRHECVAICERQNSALLHALKAEHRAGRDWTDSLQPAIGALNGAPHATTLVPPARAVCAYIQSNPLSIRAGISHESIGSVRRAVDSAGMNLALIARQIAEKLEKAQTWRRLVSSERGIYYNYAAGDSVFVQMPPRPGEVAKLHRRFQSGWKVVELLGHHCYGVQRSKGGLIRKMHASRVRPQFALPNNLLPTDGEQDDVEGEEAHSDDTEPDAAIPDEVSDVETAAREAYDNVYEENLGRPTVAQDSTQQLSVTSSRQRPTVTVRTKRVPLGRPDFTDIQDVPVGSGRQDKSPNCSRDMPTRTERAEDSRNKRSLDGPRGDVEGWPSEGADSAVLRPPDERGGNAHECDQSANEADIARLKADHVIPLKSPLAQRQSKGRVSTPYDGRSVRGAYSLEEPCVDTGKEIPRRKNKQRKPQQVARTDHSGDHQNRSAVEGVQTADVERAYSLNCTGNDHRNDFINPPTDSVTVNDGGRERHSQSHYRRSGRERRQPERLGWR